MEGSTTTSSFSRFRPDFPLYLYLGNLRFVGWKDVAIYIIFQLHLQFVSSASVNCAVSCRLELNSCDFRMFLYEDMHCSYISVTHMPP